MAGLKREGAQGALTEDRQISREKVNRIDREARIGKLSRREFVTAAVAAGLTVASADAMFSEAVAATPKKGGVLRIALGSGSTSDTLDPALFLNTYMFTVGQTIGNALTQVDAQGDIHPDLADSFEPSERAKTWVVKLRTGVTFHNGKTVTASDVVASIRHHMGASSKSALKSLLRPIVQVKPDGNNIIFNLKDGDLDFPYVLSEYRLSIMPATDDGDVDWRSGARTGPYMLEEFKPGQSTKVKRNPNYFADTWFDNVEILSVVDTSARTNALLSGQIDYMDSCDPRVFAILAKRAGIKADKVIGSKHQVFSMNVTAPPFDNPDVRNAIKYAVDREAILNKVFGGIGAVGNDNPIAPTAKFAIVPKPIHSYDPERARSLLKKAGLSGLDIKLSTSDVVFEGAVDSAVIFQQSAAKAGINIDVVREPADGYWDNVWLKKPFIASTWKGRSTVGGTLTFAYAADSTQNETFWKNPRFNELLSAARSELDEGKRAAMYAECQQLLHDDGGVIVLLFAAYLTAHSDKVTHGPLLSHADIDGYKIAQRWWTA